MTFIMRYAFYLLQCFVSVALQCSKGVITKVVQTRGMVLRLPVAKLWIVLGIESARV